MTAVDAAPHIYTREELRTPTGRPSVRKGEPILVEATLHRPEKGDDARYRVTAPCCGIATFVSRWAVDRADRHNCLIECGKPWAYRRGNPTRGGCRAWYRIVPRHAATADRPAIFELTWNGR